jgi:hypothetical protein
VYGFTFF